MVLEIIQVLQTVLVLLFKMQKTPQLMQQYYGVRQVIILMLVTLGTP